MPRSWNRIGGWRLKYERIPVVKRPIDVLNRVLVILMHVFSQDEYNFLQTIASNNSLPFNFDIYRASEAEQDKLLDLLKTNYDRGYRIFISTQGSFALAGIFDWLNSRPDVLVINTPSTLSVQNYSAILGVDVLPYNLIRTAIPDNEMILTLFKDILFKLPSILKTSEQNELYEPLQHIPDNAFPFNNIVYIHIPSGYTYGYLQTLTETMNTLNLNVELTALEITDVSGNYVLPNDAKYYLAYNNIRNDQYVDSNDKPLIILNCEPNMKNELMALLNKENYYNNYTLLSDSFATVFDTSYNFTASLMPIGNFSRRGYVLSSIVDDTQSISPFILNIFDIFANCGTFFKNLLNNNFRASNMIDQFINVKIMKTNSWSDKNLIVSKIQRTSDISTDTSWKWEILFKKQNYNFEEIAIISSSTQVITYPDNLVFGNDYGAVNNFIQNQFLTDNATTGTTINSYLDNKHLFLPSEQYLINYKNFLIQNFTKQMPLVLFNQYMLFLNVNTYNISVKQLEPITIDVIIEIENFLNNDTFVDVHIPEISYDLNEYFYDTSGNGSYIDEYTREFKTDGIFNLITDGSFNIRVPILDTFDLFLFKGHIVRIGKNENIYFDGDISFNVLKTVRGYVNQPINLNFLVIENDYEVGDKVIVKQCGSKREDNTCSYLNTGFINDISANKYYVDVSFAEYKDPSSGNFSYNVIKPFTQEEIYPDPSFNRLNITVNQGGAGLTAVLNDAGVSTEITNVATTIQNQPTITIQSSGNLITHNNLGNVIMYSTDGQYILTYDMCGNLISTMPRPPTITPSNELLDTYVIGISAEDLTVSGYTVYDNEGNIILSYDNNGVIIVDNRPKTYKYSITGPTSNPLLNSIIENSQVDINVTGYKLPNVT